MSQYRGTQKVCATCAYWTGTREAAQRGQIVELKNPNDRGKCAVLKGGRRGMMVNAIGSCKDWIKWPQVK